MTAKTPIVLGTNKHEPLLAGDTLTLPAGSVALSSLDGTGSTAGQVLTSNGAGTAPSYQAAPGVSFVTTSNITPTAGSTISTNIIGGANATMGEPDGFFIVNVGGANKKVAYFN